jgi:formylglycine-generating enzyme required for sulfatase activity
VLAAGIIRTESADSLQVADLSSGQAVEALRIDGLAKGSDYVVGRFGNSDLATIIVYTSGEPGLQVFSLSESGGAFQASSPKEYSLDSGIRYLAVYGEGPGARLIATFGSGARAAVLAFDGQTEPKVSQSIECAEDEVISGLVPLDGQLVALIRRPTTWYTTHSQVWVDQDGQFKVGATQEMTTVDASVHIIEPLLQANAGATTAADMKAYTHTIPGTKVSYTMTPIPGGEFVMGTPDDEEGRQPSEGPQVKVKIDPFWMQTTEVTWDMYTLFMYPDEERKFKDSLPTEADFDQASDAVARPSKPYTEMSFGMGKDGFPAIAMTHHAANKFCQWLSAKTGHYYRLPTEAEWEYACRAGTTTAYSFGDNVDDLEDYGWYEMNSDFVYQKVGKKKPNPWGLFDMHGNVMEWCLDGFLEDYSSLAPSADNPWARATKPYPHIARGGSYDDMAEDLRSGARRPSDRSWKMTDPQLPKSTWWLSDNKMIGLRLVRPLKVLDAESLAKRWNTATERD